MNTAWKAAQDTVARLPSNAVWSFTITELEDDAVLNIYVRQELFPFMQGLLGLERPAAERGEKYLTWYNGSLAVSLIQPEEEDGRESESDE